MKEEQKQRIEQLVGLLEKQENINKALITQEKQQREFNEQVINNTTLLMQRHTMMQDQLDYLMSLPAQEGTPTYQDWLKQRDEVLSDGK